MSIHRIENLSGAGMATAERFCTPIAAGRRTLAEAALDPDGIEELMAAGLMVRDHRGEGLTPTVSLTDAGVLAVARYWVIDTGRMR